MGRIRTPRRSQPQQPVAVDFPYAKASLCVNYAVGGKNLIDGSNPSVRSGAGTRAPSAFGVCKTGYDGGSNTAADVYGIPSTSVFTLVCVYDLSGSSGSYSPIIGGDQTGNRQFQLRVTPSNTIEFIRFNTSVSTFTATTTTTGRTGCIVAVSNGSSVRLIHKGIVSSTATITGTPKPLTVVAPGGYLGFDQQPLVKDRGVSMCAVLPFALSNAEAVALSLNPWQIFAKERIWVPVAAGGGTTISATTGNAVADGVTAALIKTIATTTGDGVANGVTASILRTIAASVGNAVADGSTASLIKTIATAVGNAVADGVLAGISGSVVIATTTGNAVADGVVASIVRTIVASPGDAVANGALATLLQTIATITGNAVANGTTANIIAGDPLTLILKILSNKQMLDAATGLFTIYDDDGVSVLYQSHAWADVGGTVPYSGGQLRRIDALA